MDKLIVALRLAWAKDGVLDKEHILSIIIVIDE
jgi:hypothetical protein